MFAKSVGFGANCDCSNRKNSDHLLVWKVSTYSVKLNTHNKCESLQLPPRTEHEKKKNHCYETICPLEVGTALSTALGNTSFPKIAPSPQLHFSHLK